MDRDELIKGDALLKSIEKWELIVTGEGIDLADDNCALCQLYIDNNCRECPVRRRSGKSGCNNSPYHHWSTHHCNDHYLHRGPKRVLCEECKRLAEKELDFLRSLIVEEKTYEIGDHFFHSTSGNLYVLAKVLSSSHPEGPTAMMVNVDTGNMFRPQEKVKHLDRITSQELLKIANSDFEKVELKPFEIQR